MSKATRPGAVNKNDQMVLRKGKKSEANHKFARLYVLRCNVCLHEYGANGCDLHHRRCPKCTDAQPGLPYD